MSLNAMQDFTFKHSLQIDDLDTQYTGQQIKALFDSRGDELRTFINNLVSILSASTGAANIGVASITDIDGSTIQAMIQSIRDKLKSKTDGSSGADFVNATAIAGLTGETVQALLESLKTYVDNQTASDIEATPIAVNSGNTVQQQLVWLLSQIAVASTGAIPDGSLGEIKLDNALLAKINTALSNTGVLTTLLTTDKSSSVNAINETLVIPTAGGTSTAITLSLPALTDHYIKTFIANANNSGSATTINGKPLYKPNTTAAPTLIAGKAYTVWYSATGNGGNGCFFIKASAEGNTIPSHVLAGDTYSGDDIIGGVGTMVSNGTTKATLKCTLQNLVANGSFEDGANGWTVNGSMSIVSTDKKFGNYAAFQNGTTAGSGYYAQSFNTVLNHKFYYSAWCKNLSNINVVCDITSYGVDTLSFTPNSQFAFNSAIFTCTDSAAHNLAVGWNATTGNGAGAWLDGICMIDLTVAFGAGNEPTKAQMDTIINSLGGWFDGCAILNSIPSGAYITNGVTGNPDVLMYDANFIANNVANNKSVFGLAGKLTGLSACTAGTNLIHNDISDAYTTNTSPTKVKEARINISGTIRVSFALYSNQPSGTAYGQIYVNGVARGTLRTTPGSTSTTYTEDISINNGDLIQIYSYMVTYGAHTSNFTIGIAETFPFATKIL